MRQPFVRCKGSAGTPICRGMSAMHLCHSEGHVFRVGRGFSSFSHDMPKPFEPRCRWMREEVRATFRSSSPTLGEKPSLNVQPGKQTNCLPSHSQGARVGEKDLAHSVRTSSRSVPALNLRWGALSPIRQCCKAGRCRAYQRCWPTMSNRLCCWSQQQWRLHCLL